MAKVYLEHNPFSETTRCEINSVDVTKEPEFAKCWGDPEKSFLQDWVNDFFYILHERENESEYEVEFFGLPSDYKDIENAEKDFHEKNSMIDIKLIQKDINIKSSEQRIKGLKELFEDIFEADKSYSDKFSDMIDWVCQFHESQTVFYGCPIGNLIVELSTEDENFRCPLNDFMTQWTEKLASLLQDMHADWSEERSQLQARQVISSIQGSIVILKVSQDIQVLENNMTDLKKNYC